MKAFARRLTEMGYQKVETIDTMGETFMTKGKATWTGLPGSAILTGIK